MNFYKTHEWMDVCPMNQNLFALSIASSKIVDIFDKRQGSIVRWLGPGLSDSIDVSTSHNFFIKL